MVLLLYVPTAKGSEINDFLRALQDSLHKLGDPWIAGETEISNLSWEEKQKLCGGVTFPSLKEIANDPVLRAHNMSGKLSQKTPPPSEWDWRNVDGHDWMTQPKNQGCCRADWAFSTIGAFEARLKIINDIPDDRYNPDLSEQFMVSCDTRNNGCIGGHLHLAAEFVVETGVPDEACFPYEARNLS